MKVLITGSSGLVGSTAVEFFCLKGYDVVGIDNDSRKYFFGKEASVEWNQKRLSKIFSNFKHFDFDIRNEIKIAKLFKEDKFDLIIHTAAQPSHDWAAREPLTDFTINSLGTTILLENYRKYQANAVFIFTSTNKVYGDNPNKIPLLELDKRYEPKDLNIRKNGIPESMSLDNCVHSVFGVSKAAADLMVQEYGKNFGLKTCVFRLGCITGASHSSTQLHGFLAYLVATLARGETYTIFGYKGKQVRDNIHAYDLVNAMYHFYKNPRPGEVYNLGGSTHSNISVLEAISKIEAALRKKAKFKYLPQNRTGDHIWYVSDITKFRNNYPMWDFKYDINSIINELCESGHF